MSYPALIFDFDGTIADTFAEGIRIYNELAEEYSLRAVSHDEIEDLRDLTTNDLMNHLGVRRSKLPVLLTKGRRRLKRSISRLPLIAGMGDVLPELRSQSTCFGILTSNAADNVESFLESHGLTDLFTFVSTTSKLSGKHKHLRSIARTFSLDPKEMLYIGDEIRDVRAAQKAGIACTAVSWGFNSRDSLIANKPTYIADHPNELPGICHG